VQKDGGEGVHFARRRGHSATFCPAGLVIGSICLARYLIEVNVPELRQLARLFLKLGTLGA
jgi:hypothetical protein